MFNKLRHSGCYGGTEQEALQAYQEEIEQKIAEDLAKSAKDQLIKSENALLK